VTRIPVGVIGSDLSLAYVVTQYLDRFFAKSTFLQLQS
jgi:hypothetical protein